MTQGTMFPSSKGSGTGKTQAPTSLGASAREGCWHRQPQLALSDGPNSGDERGRETEKEKPFLPSSESLPASPSSSERWRGRGAIGAGRRGRRGRREVQDRKKEKSELSSFALLRQGHKERKGEPHTSPTLRPQTRPPALDTPRVHLGIPEMMSKTQEASFGWGRGNSPAGSHHEGLLREAQQALKKHQLALGGRARRVLLGRLSQAVPPGSAGFWGGYTQPRDGSGRGPACWGAARSGLAGCSRTRPQDSRAFAPRDHSPGWRGLWILFRLTGSAPREQTLSSCAGEEKGWRG